MAEKSAFFSSHPTGISNSSRGGTTGGQLPQDGETSSPASSSSQRPLAKRRCARESKADTCAICMGPVEDRGVMLKRLSCGTYTQSCAHAHCFTCVMTWAERTNTCPMCKERFSAVRHKHGVRPFGAGGETVEVKDRDPMADCSSEDESLAAMLALQDDSDLEEGGEEHGTSQEVSHGYNVDDFVVHDDDAAEEANDGREQEWQEGGASAQRTRSSRSVGDSDRTRRQTRALRGSRRAGGESYFSERQGVYRQTRGQGIGTRRSGGGVETRTRATRGGGGGVGGGLSGGLVDSDDDEVGVLPDELRQLQREAARVIGDSPLRPRRRPPQLSRLSRYPRRFNSATAGFGESSARLRRDRSSNTATGGGSQSSLETARGLRSLNSRRAVTTPRLTRSSIEEEGNVDDDVGTVVPRSAASAATRRVVEARSPVEVAASSRRTISEEQHVSSGVVTSRGTTNRTWPTTAIATSPSVSEKPVPAVGRAARLPAAPQWGPWISRRPSSSIELAGRLPWQSPAESSNARTGAIERTRCQQRVLRINNTRMVRSAVATGSTARRQGIMPCRWATRGASTAASSDNGAASTRQSAGTGCSSDGGNVGRAGGKDEAPVVRDGGGADSEESEGPRNTDFFETTGQGEGSSALLGQSAASQGVANRLVGRKQDENACFGSDAFEKENQRDQEEEEQEEEFEWRVGPVASRNKRPRVTEPEEEEGKQDQEDEFDCFMTGASLPTKEHQAKEKSVSGTEEGSTGEGGVPSPSPARPYSSSRLVQNGHRRLPDSTDARGSGGFGGGRNVRQRLTTAGGAGTTVASSSSPPPSPVSSLPSSSSHRGFGLRGPLQCGMETEKLGLTDRLLRHRGGCSRTGGSSTQNGDPPVFANADELCESDDDGPSSDVGRVEGDARGAAGKGVLFDSDDDESSPVRRVGGETRGAAGKGRAGCDWRRAQRKPQHGRGLTSNVPSAHGSSHVSVGLFDKFRFTGARA